MQKWLASMLVIWSLSAMPASGMMERNCPLDPLRPGDYTFTLRVGESNRVYDLHIPRGGESAKPMPLVIDIHGYTGNKREQARLSDFKSLSNSDGFLVAYPQGINNQWYAGNTIFLGDPKIDDVAFIRALVADVAKRVRIDHSRVYVTGHSNGSMLSHRIACEAADLFAGIAGVSGGLQYRNFNDCRPSRPISVKMFHGYIDTIVPYKGSRMRFRPIRETFDFWASTNRCSGTPQITTNGRNRCETYTDCANGTQVSLCSLVAAHINIYGVSSLNVSEAAWSFFRQFRVPLPDTDRDGIPDEDECNLGGSGANREELPVPLPRKRPNFR